MIRKPKILLLDEATNALDEESQCKVQEAVKKVLEGRTSIVVARSLTTMERCSRVAVIDDGKIIEEGSFSQLIKKENGFFANMTAGMMLDREFKEMRRMAMMEHVESRIGVDGLW